MTTKDTKKRTILLPLSPFVYQEYMENTSYAHEIIKDCYEKNKTFKKPMTESNLVKYRSSLNNSHLFFHNSKININLGNF